MSKELKVICTIGPASFKPEILNALKARGADFFRINLSHTDEEEIEEKVKSLIEYGVPIILDTEGNQIRSGNREEREYKEGEEVILHNKPIDCDSKNLFLNPCDVIGNLREGDLISLGFNYILMRVVDVLGFEQTGQVKCRVVLGGSVGGRKAVHVHSDSFVMPPFSKKDFRAIEIAKKYGIKHFTLSFMENPEWVRQFRSLYPSSVLYSKIESRKGLDNFIEIAEESDGVLIDRGDLSNQVPVERIPLVQKYIIKKVRERGKEAFVATNTLEEMATSLKPNRSEVNDIINTVLDGASGFALTKEIAVGNYPVETLNMLNVLIKQLDFIKEGGSENIIENIERTNYTKSGKVPSLLIEPHGGELVNRVSDKRYNESMVPRKKIEIDERTLMDVGQIAIGSFSPLKGFMKEKDFNSVVDCMRLSDGIVWPLPIVLRVDEQTKENLKVGEEVALSYEGDGQVYATIKVDDIYKPNLEESAMKVYGTIDKTHPGVRSFLEDKPYFIGGDIMLLKRRNTKHKVFELTPMQTRKIFSDRGWSRVVGFHTRNVIHRSHEFIQLDAMKKSMADGLLVHPVIGKKKTGDFEADIIVKAYETMISNFYPKGKVLFSALSTYSRYCGPREAIFTALVRKNFGCSHFIVGRDHTGVGSFYHPKASHEIFDKFSKEDLGIVPVIFDKVFYSDIEKKYFNENEIINHPEDKKMHISGTQAREMLEKGISPPDWFMRQEISEMILQKLKNGEEVFVK